MKNQNCLILPFRIGNSFHSYYAILEETIRTKGGKLIESVTLFDIYEGAQLTQGYKSMAYKIVFRAPDRTLKDEEVNKAMDKIVRALEEKEIVLRS